MEERITTKSAAGIVALCYVMWGSLPAFWKLLSEVNPVYVLSHRIVWSIVFVTGYALYTKSFHEITSVFKDKKLLVRCFISSILITINWGVYIYAMTAGRVFESSLGYFIEPIMVALMGVFIFKEKMNIYEKITLVFAAFGMIYLIIASGRIPIVSLLIAGSFAAYGGVKKTFSLLASTSLFMETLYMVIPSLIFISYCEAHLTGAVGVLSNSRLILLPIAGIVTLIPLLLFNMGVKKIPYYISGIIMYINPTIQFLMGLFVFKEDLDKSKLIAFIFIWVGSLFTIYDKCRRGRTI